ncbi:hypothetical protein ANCDUO_21223, partial [Ancylostoma duodenale]
GAFSDTNLAALIHCSHRFQIPSLQRELYQYLENELPSEDCKLKPETLADAIAEALNAHFSPKFIAHMYKKFGEHGLDKMQEALKNMPNPLAETILSEARKYMVIAWIVALLIVPLQYRWQAFSAGDNPRADIVHISLE